MNKRGFTLLEMIFVLSVISLVFLLTIPNIQKALSLLHDKGCEAQLTLVNGAILQYELSYLNPPSSGGLCEGVITMPSAIPVLRP